MKEKRTIPNTALPMKYPKPFRASIREQRCWRDESIIPNQSSFYKNQIKYIWNENLFEVGAAGCSTIPLVS